MHNHPHHGPPSLSRTAIIALTCILLLIPLAGAQTSGGPVSVPCCPENGMACTGGDDCIDGICHKVCKNTPFDQDCDCQVSRGGDDNGIIWIVLIGTVAVLAGGGLALRARGKKGAEQKDKEKEKKKQVTYILQLNTDRMTVAPDKPGTLVVTVWKQEAGGALRHAPEAAIRIQVPAVSSGLKVLPAMGQGTLSAQVGIEGSIRAGEVVLTVTSSAAGTSESASVTVVIEQDYVMEFF